MLQLHRLARKFIDVRREQQMRWLLSNFVTVKHHSCAENVYHCCVWKTASQWIRNFLSATSIYQYSGLLTYAYEQHEGRDDRALQDRTFDQPFPLKKIVSPLYISYDSFERLPKPASYRAFFVARDPRDLVVSHYFSSRYSHVENPGILEERSQLEGLTETEGMLVHMKYMADRGVFEALRSWAQHSGSGGQIRIFRFEDLVGRDQHSWMSQMLEHCDIRLPQRKLEAILDNLSFQRLSGGRRQGEENKFHKYRSGKWGDWQKYFDGKLSSEFQAITGSLAHDFGYKQ